jgi:hypothetical protein
MAETAPAKVCIHCAEDCSTKARVKDSQGRYACKGCHEQALAKAAAAAAARPVTVARPATAASALGPDAIALADEAGFDPGLLQSALDGVATPQTCPACGSGMPTQAVMCTICGFNTRTGKAATVTVLKDAGDDLEPTEKKGVAKKIAEAPAMLMLGTLGSLIGGVVGAGIWALVAYQINYEIGWLAVGVGALVGGGMAKGAQGYTGALTGLVAAIIAVGAVMGGRYMAISAVVDDFGKQANKQVARITEDDARVELARSIAHEQEDAGRRLKWPEGMDEDQAGSPQDFPQEVWAQTERRWTAMTPDERADYLDRIRAEQRELVTSIVGAAKNRGFVASFEPIDILFLLLAVGAGFSIGSGGKAS